MTYPTPTIRPLRDREVYTEDEILKAIDLKRRLGLTWIQVGERLGRSPNTINTHVSRYLKGQLKFCKPHYEKVIEIIAQELIAGSTISESARRHDRHRSAVHTSLKRRGWDQETIREMRKGRQSA